MNEKTGALIEAIDCIAHPMEQTRCKGAACQFYAPGQRCTEKVLNAAKLALIAVENDDAARVYSAREIYEGVIGELEWRGMIHETTSVIVTKAMDGLVSMAKGSAKITKSLNDYGVNWRLWSESPSSLIREATPWATNRKIPG